MLDAMQRRLDQRPIHGVGALIARADPDARRGRYDRRCGELSLGHPEAILAFRAASRVARPAHDGGLGDAISIAQIGVVGLDGQIELERSGSTSLRRRPALSRTAPVAWPSPRPPSPRPLPPLRISHPSSLLRPLALALSSPQPLPPPPPPTLPLPLPPLPRPPPPSFPSPPPPLPLSAAPPPLTLRTCPYPPPSCAPPPHCSTSPTLLPPPPSFPPPPSPPHPSPPFPCTRPPPPPSSPSPSRRTLHPPHPSTDEPLTRRPHAAPALLCGAPALLFVVETTFEKRTVAVAVIAAEQAATSVQLVASGAEAAEGSIDPDRAKALTRHTVVAWEGVGDRHGAPAASALASNPDNAADAILTIKHSRLPASFDGGATAPAGGGRGGGAVWHNRSHSPRERGRGRTTVMEHRCRTTSGSLAWR